jgi:hypothetical protein
MLEEKLHLHLHKFLKGINTLLLQYSRTYGMIYIMAILQETDTVNLEALALENAGEEHDGLYTENVAALRRALDNYGAQDDDLGGIRILGVEVGTNEGDRFKIADGPDALNFFQIDQGAQRQQSGSRVEFYDEKGHQVTPDLCVRVEIGDEGRTYNLIASDEKIFELETQDKEELPTPGFPVGRRTSQVKSQVTYNGPIFHADDHSWVNKILSVNVQRVPSKGERNFMKTLKALTSEAIEGFLSQGQPTSAPLPNVIP